MHNEKPDFFCVSLAKNIQTLKTSIPRLNKFYNNPNFSIICPDDSLEEFKQEIRYKNVTFIAESSILSLSVFKDIVDTLAAKEGVDEKDIAFINWYYQQVLKITFALKGEKSDTPIIMVDADTILLKKIDFFQGDKSKLYGSLSEFHQPYFQTLKFIFGELPKSFNAFTIQFFSMTNAEKSSLISRMERFLPRESNEPMGIWISRVMISGVMSTHHKFCPAFFSEQEFVGISNKLLSFQAQKPITHLRYGFKGPLSEAQLYFVKLLGFVHLTYEPIEQFITSKQSWRLLIKHAFRELYRQRTKRYIKRAAKGFQFQ